MLQIFFAYILTIPVMIMLDLAWIGVIMKDFYQKGLAVHMATQINWYAAAAFYLLFIAGVFYFAAYPAHVKGSLWQAVLLGALLGLLAYGTYDLTNMATFKEWPLAITVVDMAWGAFLTATVSAAGYGLLAVFR